MVVRSKGSSTYYNILHNWCIISMIHWMNQTLFKKTAIASQTNFDNLSVKMHLLEQIFDAH